MKAISARVAAAASAFAMGLLVLGSAGAQCVGVPISPNNNQQTAGHGRLIRAAYSPNDTDVNPPGAVIVGMWHVKFTATVVSEGVPFPPGTEFDAGYQQWHSDGTEMLNSGGRPPSTSSFCMGVWTQTGPRTFKLNHFAISWSDPTTRQGPTSISEEVTVSKNGRSFSGTFTITDYVETDNSNPATNSVTVHDTIQGTVTGTLMDANTPAEPLF